MKIEYVFDNYYLKEENLVGYGFIREGNYYKLKKSLDDKDFYCVFVITNKIFDVRVFESDGEEYLPFYIKKNNGSYSAKIKEKVELLIADILFNCFQRTNIKEQLIEYVKDKFQTIPEYPWKKDPTSATLKTANSNKWYGLIMNIPFQALKINKSGNIDVLNVKVDPDKINSLIDRIHYFPAYHMNKKHWLSIILDGDVDLDVVKELLTKSYKLVEK